jgi:hypothetical protein
MTKTMSPGVVNPEPEPSWTPEEVAEILSDPETEAGLGEPLTPEERAAGLKYLRDHA